MKFNVIIVLTVLSFILSGCSGFNQKEITAVSDLKTKEDIVSATKKVENSTKIIDEKSENIEKEAIKIQENANEAKLKVPDETKAILNPHLDSIKTSSETIIEDIKQIDIANLDIETAKELLIVAKEKIEITDRELNKIVKERDIFKKEKEKAIADKNSQLNKMIQWLIVSCIIGAGVSCVMFFLYGNKNGIVIAACCIVTLILAITINTYMAYLAIGGGVLLVAMVGYLIWNVYIQKKALREIVDTVEVTKDSLSKKIKMKLFGGEGETGIMDTLQSKSTMDIIKKEKSKLSPLWKYTKNHKNGQEEMV